HPAAGASASATSDQTAVRAGTPLPPQKYWKYGFSTHSVAQRLVGEVVRVLENEQPGHQPRRQRRLPGSHATHRAETSRQKIPIDLSGQPHQRMAKIDDLVQRRAKQVVLTIVARLAHRSLPDSESRRRGNHEPPKSGI